MVKIAIIGAGYMSREHVRAFKGLPDLELAGIISRTRSKAEALAGEYNISHVCDSIDELYNKTKADLVIVSVSVLKTKEIVLEALQYPWLQLIEKPVGCSVLEGEEILAAFRASGRTGFAAFNRRFYSSTQTVIKDQIASNTSRRLVCVYDQEDPWVKTQEPKPQQLIDCWMYANSIHLIDYFRFLGRGRIILVDPIIKWDPTNPFTVLAQINFESGDTGLYQAIWGAPGPWAVTVTTKEKRWELRPLEQASCQVYGSRSLETTPVEKADIDFKAGIRAQAEEAVKAVKGLPNSLVTLEDSLETMKLVRSIYGV